MGPGGGGEVEEGVEEYTAGPPPPPIPQVNFASFILNKLKQHPKDKVALVDAESQEERRCGEVAAEVPRVAGGLALAGVRPGDGVLILAATHLDYPLLLLGVVYVGGVGVLLNPALNPEELARAVGVSGAKWAVVEDGVRPRVEAARALLPPGTLKGVWSLGRSGGGPSTSPSLRDLLQAPPVPPCPMEGVVSTTPALMFFSSGTTGLPKGVMLSHTALLAPHACNRYLMSMMEGGEGLQAVLRETLRAMLIMMPLYHIYGYACTVFCLSFGATAVLLPKFSPRKLLSTIQKYKVTVCPLVPHMADFLAKSPLVGEYDLSSLRALSSASSPLSTATVEGVLDKIGLSVSNGYGLTEAINIATTGSLFGECPGSVGRVMPYMQVKIVEVGGSGRVLGRGQDGEVCVRGPTVMLGYANAPEATAAALDSQGWLHTGDMGHFNEDGFLFLTDRIKDLIKVKGFQVSSRELEEVLERVEGVAEVAVVGVPHSRTAEAPRAFVALQPGAQVTPERLRRAVEERVSPAYKHLTGGVEVVDALPRNASGKILKRQLRDQFIASSRSKL